MRTTKILLVGVLCLAAAGYTYHRYSRSEFQGRRSFFEKQWLVQYQPSSQYTESESNPQQNFYYQLADAALAQTLEKVTYDPAYVKIAYPGGDVPKDRGVCADVVIRAYRALGIDLQVLVHQDMRKHFELYPKIWGLRAPDTNIDHRRVPNLMRFFARHGTVLSIDLQPEIFLAGDLVTWTVAGNLPHIGIISDQMGSSGRLKIIHNIGAGPQLEDRLFDWPMTGHFRFEPIQKSHPD